MSERDSLTMAMLAILILLLVAIFGCAGVPPGAVSWQALPPAPAPTTEALFYKGKAPIGRVYLNSSGSWTMIGCLNGVASHDIGIAPDLSTAEATVQKSCGY